MVWSQICLMLFLNWMLRLQASCAALQPNPLSLLDVVSCAAPFGAVTRGGDTSPNPLSLQSNNRTNF